ncbi:hypothetical protein TELCIR_16826 [Teladorsagia circumcincta]|uniref:Amino acid permease/ SLC12A domain-containing protein n=1 Tax=Teladorsagia circumcincta TaxID=45464 RepID=A0A2G9TUI1_TELCI|nr:hypothetical protein TELCIR_16826 [Teladorsagia circumcincta]
MTRKEVNRLGVLGATSYIIGSVIGSGIFVSPKGILEHTGSVGLSLIVWIGAAVLASLTAIALLKEDSKKAKLHTNARFITELNSRVTAYLPYNNKKHREEMSLRLRGK